MTIRVRPAVFDDWPTLVEFNCQLAEETEGKRLDPAIVEPGVKAVLDDPAKGRYLVACVDASGSGSGDPRTAGRLVGQLMHTREWSDWRNGDIWWLQSVYVHPDFRRAGVFRSLLEELRRQAETDPAVVGLRLYVEEHNEKAVATYKRLGFDAAGYLVMERMHRRHV